MSNSSLRNRLLRFLRPPLFLFSFSPSNEQLRRNWINLDGEKFRAEEGQPAKTLFRVAFRSMGSADGFRISDPVVIDLPVKSGTVTRRYPDLVEEEEEGGRPGAGLLKFFIVALFPFGQEARLRKTESKYFEKIGSTEIRKSGLERNSCSSLGERMAKSRERGRTREQWRKWRVTTRFSHESRKSLGPISATSFDGSTGNRVGGEVCSEKRKLARIIRFVRPNLPICFPFTASLYLCAFPFSPSSFFILSYIFFALPFATTGAERT